MANKRDAPKASPSRISSVRFRPEDVRLIEQLQKDTGIESVTDLLRLALRTLGRERGLK